MALSSLTDPWLKQFSLYDCIKLAEEILICKTGSHDSRDRRLDDNWIKNMLLALSSSSIIDPKNTLQLLENLPRYIEIIFMLFKIFKLISFSEAH